MGLRQNCLGNVLRVEGGRRHVIEREVVYMHGEEVQWTGVGNVVSLVVVFIALGVGEDEDTSGSE